MRGLKARAGDLHWPLLGSSLSAALTQLLSLFSLKALCRGGGPLSLSLQLEPNSHLPQPWEGPSPSGLGCNVP